MEIRENALYFLCMFILCKAAEIPKVQSAGEASEPEIPHSGDSAFVRDTNDLRFYKKNDSSASTNVPPHTNTKWSPWIPIPHGYNVKKTSSIQKENTLNASIENVGNEFISKNSVSKKTDAEFNLSNTTLNETFLYETNLTDTASVDRNKTSYVVTPSSETTKSLSNVRNHKNRVSYSQGITYYFWDTVFLILKCFKDHWKAGVVDCMTTRASKMLDGLLGIGATRRHELVNKGGFELMPYDEILEESPRNKEGLALDEDEEEEEEEEDEEQEAYDEEVTDSREGEEQKYSKKKIRKANRHMKLILMAIIASMIPIVAAAKLKYFIMVSLGLGLLGMIVGKTIMFSILALPAAIIGGYKRDHYGFLRRMNDMTDHHPLSRVGTDPYAARLKKQKRRKLYKGKKIYKLLHIVVSTAVMALPVIIALKLKFFMMLSVGIAALSLVSGKAFILSMVSFVLAIVAILKKATHKGYSIGRVDDFSGHPPYASRKALEDVYPGGRANTNYFM